MRYAYVWVTWQIRKVELMQASPRRFDGTLPMQVWG